MQKTSASTTTERISQLILSFVPFLALISCAALAADPQYYVKKGTWQETMIASREALMRQEQAIGGVPLPNLGKSDFTMMAWIRTTADTGTIVAKAPARAGWEPQGKVFFLREGNLIFDVGWVGAVGADAPVNDGQWHHVALAGRKPLWFYVDGNPVGSGSLGLVEQTNESEQRSDVTAMRSDDPEHVMKIGYCTPDFPDGGSFFKGDIDDVRVYSRRLSPAEIKAVYNSSEQVRDGLAGWWEFEEGAKDSSGGGNDGEIHDAVPTEGRMGNALRFNGKSSFVLLPKSARMAARNNIWNCIYRDFTRAEDSKQIQREQRDNIWTEDWKTGDLTQLGRRYADACKRIGDLPERAARLATRVNSFAELKKVIDLYHSSCFADEVSVSVRTEMALINNEIDYLDEQHSPNDMKWRTYKMRAKSLTQTADSVILRLAEGDVAANERLAGVSRDLQRLHAEIPLKLPSGPAGPGRFGAYYARLKYSLGWDKPWRVAAHPDVVVRFDDAGYKFVFWRGTSYIPCWGTDTGVWYSNEFIERRGHDSPKTEGCVEPLSDKQCRFSHVRIIESSDARVVVHWRYAPVDVRYNHAFADPLTGWSDWVDEIYTIYPDAVGVRKITVYTTRPDLWMEWQESIVVNQPGTRPEDNIELAAVTLANLKGQSKTYYWTKDGAPDFGEPEGAHIVKINLKAKHSPFAIVEPAKEKGILITPYEGHAAGSYFNFWDHWPVSQDASDGRMATSADRPSHSSLCHIGLAGMATATWPYHAQGDNWRTKIMLHGMTNKAADELALLAKSWLQPPDLQIKTDRFGESAFDSQGYDPTQRAYVLRCKKPNNQPSRLEFRLAAGEDRPLINPAFVLKSWGSNSKASLEINGKVVAPRKDFRQGLIRDTDGSRTMIIWVRLNSIKPLKIVISSKAT